MRDKLIPTVVLYVRISPELQEQLNATLASEEYTKYVNGNYVRRSMQRLVGDLLAEAIAARSAPPAKTTKTTKTKRAAAKRVVRGPQHELPLGGKKVRK